MKIRLVTFIVLMFFFSCNQLGQQITPSEECKKSVQFGDIFICFPEIDGMQECYADPLVKSKAFKNESGTILAVYLNNKTYEQVEKLNEMKFDDYFTVYGVDKLKGVSVDYSLLDQMSDAFEKNSIKDNWEDIKNKIEKSYDYISLGKPVFLERYIPSKDIRSSVFLSKAQANEKEYIYLTIINLLLIKERVIWAVYYKDYKDQESIQSAKTKNDYMTLLMIAENK